MTVRRTLPQKARSLIGAWCFVDHYGPDDVADTGGMLVPPHPHTGLQTVTWLFTGEVEHRDSGGAHALVRPGAVNLMTAGRGVAHSEVSNPGTTTLHGVQLWVALPTATRDAPRAFEHHQPPAVDLQGATLRVFLGALAGSVSPVRTHTPLLGAEVVLPPGGRLELDVDAAYEHGLLVDSGAVALCGTPLVRGELGYTGIGAPRLVVEDLDGAGARLLLFGDSEYPGLLREITDPPPLLFARGAPLPAAPGRCCAWPRPRWRAAHAGLRSGQTHRPARRDRSYGLPAHRSAIRRSRAAPAPGCHGPHPPVPRRVPTAT